MHGEPFFESRNPFCIEENTDGFIHAFRIDSVQKSHLKRVICESDVSEEQLSGLMEFHTGAFGNVSRCVVSTKIFKTFRNGCNENILFF